MKSERSTFHLRFGGETEVTVTEANMESFPSDLPEEMNGEPSKALPGLMPCGMPAYKFSSCKLCPVPQFCCQVEHIYFASCQCFPFQIIFVIFTL